MKAIIDITDKKLVLQKEVREWCRFSYPGHPKGCPNYGIKKTCPPKIPLVQEIFNLKKPHYLGIISFDLATHMKNMALKHPDWSNRQLRCCLYWQGKIKKELKILCEQFVKNMKGYDYTSSPEAMGVNVFRTLHYCGIKIRKCAYPILYKVALIACKK